LAATSTFLDLSNPPLASGIYHFQVAANNSTVTAIRLFSTVGLLGTLTNQPSATFEINAGMLGPGSHPFYALVDALGGIQYRTQPVMVRFVSP
jgi:hypothetical protein